MPTFILGLMDTYFSYRARVNAQRRTINVPIDSSYYEWKYFLTLGLLPGIVLSLFSFGMGIPLTLEWVFLFEVVSVLVLLLFGYRFIHPVFTMTGTTGLYLLINYFYQKGKISEVAIRTAKQWFPFLKMPLIHEAAARNAMIILPLVVIATVFVYSKYWKIVMNPRFMKSPRGKIVARYRMKPFWVLPLLIVVPGQIFTQFAPWWPTFGWGSQRYTLLLLPILVGLRYTVQSQEARAASEKIQKDFFYLSILALVFAGLSYFYPSLIIYFTIILFIAGLFILIRHRRRERRWHFLYGPGEEGLRVVAIRDNSPAERMGIKAGDELLVGNDQPLTHVDTYYEMVIENRSYVKLRIRQLDGEIVIVETPIYEEDPYDLGIVLLDNLKPTEE